MPRLNYVKSARKSKHPRTCRKCGTKIKVGDSYYWFANKLGRSSSRKDYCAAHRPRPSDMTTSDKLSRIYAAQEAVEDACVFNGDHTKDEFESFRDDLAEALSNGANELREVGQEYKDNVQNMPEGLQQGSTAQEMEEKGDNLESWADSWESAASDISGTEFEDPPKKDEDSPSFQEIIDAAETAKDEVQL